MTQVFQNPEHAAKWLQMCPVIVTAIPSIFQSRTRPKAIARFLGQTRGRAPRPLSSKRHQKELVVANEPA